MGGARVEPDFEVVADVDRGDRVVELAVETNPDVALLDLEMPRMDGIDAAVALRDRVDPSGSQRTRVIDPVLVAEAKTGSSPLTDRETEVLASAERGLEPRRSPQRWRSARRRCASYLSAAMTKLHARNRVDAIRIAREAGWLDSARRDV